MSSELSSKPVLGYIEIRVFSHATEDSDKVQKAVRNTLPDELGINLVFQKTNLTGHHGNPITLLAAKLLGKQDLTLALKKIGNGLTVLDKEVLNKELELHVEKSNLFLRFDKQHALVTELRFGSNDPIHFQLHFKNRTADQITSIIRDYGLLP